MAPQPEDSSDAILTGLLLVDNSMAPTKAKRTKTSKGPATRDSTFEPPIISHESSDIDSSTGGHHEGDNLPPPVGGEGASCVATSEA